MPDKNTGAGGSQTQPQAENVNQLREYRVQRRVLLSQQTKMKTTLTANGSAMTGFQLQAKLELLEQQFRQFQEVQSKLECADEDEVDSGRRDIYEESYCNLKCQIRERLESLNPRDSVVQQIDGARSVVTPGSSVSSKMQLPKLQLPRFSGKYTDWQDFIGIFRVLVHENPDLEPIERFQHLRSCLVGAPAKLIQSLEISTENYDQAMALLKARYDNKRYIFQAHVDQICSIRAWQKPTISAMRDFVDLVNSNLRALQNLGSKEQIGESLLMHILIAKLDSDTRAKWEEEACNHFGSNNNNQDGTSNVKLSTWNDLATFLEKRCTTMSFINASSHTGKGGKIDAKHTNAPVSTFISTREQSQSECQFCNQSPNHSPFACPRFMELNQSERFNLIKQLKLCLNCLREGHTAQNCKSGNKCQKCKALHHTLLHREMKSNSQFRTNTVSAVADVVCASTVLNTSTNSSIPNTKSYPQVLLATAQIQLTSNTGRSMVGRALLDSASQVNFITESVAQRLRLRKESIHLDVCGIATISTKAVHKCQIILTSLYGNFETTLEVVVLPEITKAQPQRKFDIDEWKMPAGIQLADTKFNQPQRIDILVGAEIFYELLQHGHFSIGPNLPVVCQTSLGWVVAGSMGHDQSPKQLCTNVAQRIQTVNPLNKIHTSMKLENCRKVELALAEPSIEELLTRFWQIEEVPSNGQFWSKEEQQCEQFFIDTTKKCPSTNKFTVRLPLRDNSGVLGESYQIAKRRLINLERKLSRSPQVLKDYVAFLEDYELKSHMIPLSDEEAIFNKVNYIPHHCVINATSSTTKLRVVFDASCKTSTGVSLNNLLKVGPQLQPNIFIILCRFRLHRFVVMADISQMYRQIWVEPTDARLQCILWRKPEQSKFQTFQLRTVTYGTSSAPYLAVRCLNKLAEEGIKSHPQGSAAILSDFYVDNLMSGANTIHDTKQIKHEVTELLSLGGFPLRKWATNYEEIIEDIPRCDREVTIPFGDTEVIKALGIEWSPHMDSFKFKYKGLSKECNTKRQILSQVAQFYDPLGLLSPIVIRAKMMLQALWKSKLSWDDLITPDLQAHWTNYLKQLEELNQLAIPRYVPFNTCKTQFHGFADASTKAFGACIYIRTINDVGSISCNLLCSKSRVAPIKEISIPRLELNAMVLLVDLFDSIREISNRCNAKMFGWSDSTVALAWVASEPCRWKTYIASRVSKIQQSPSKLQWNHVPTADNPADMISRGMDVINLINNDLWFRGPWFLSQDEIKWPCQADDLHIGQLPEERPTKVILLSEISIDTTQRCKFVNDYGKLIRTFCYVNRFIFNLKTKSKQSAAFTVEDHQQSLITIVQVIQRHCFAEEFRQLQKGNFIRNNHLRQLSLFIHDGVIRVGGRLENSGLTFEVAHPILLPNSHPFTKAVIRHVHRKNLHAGVQSLLNIIREQFWIPRAKSSIKEVVRKCIVCFRSKPKTYQQVMGSLPKERITPTRAFNVVGIDYCGPFNVTHRIRGRTPDKVFLAIFVCFSTKAVHVEIVFDLSTNGFLLSLTRFIARRGKCSIIFSDNAKNFVGANRELRELSILFKSQQHNKVVDEYCVKEGIDWRFIPPRSPHFGGLWEAAVKIAKHHLRLTLRSALVTHDEFHTLCCNVEAVMNSRPLTPASSDPTDLSALTPGHFLIGAPLTSLACPKFDERNITHRKRFQYMQALHQSFWTRWSREYLCSLQTRNKWYQEKPNLKPDDLVIMKEDNLPPMKWCLARVKEVHPGRDGRVRVVTVRTPTGTYQRAITKLCPLPINDETTLNN